MAETRTNQQEIYTYAAPWTTYSSAWCRRQDGRYRMAIGGFKEAHSNQVQLIQLNKDNLGYGHFTKLYEFDVPYPPTKVMFAPSSLVNYSNKDLLATTGDYLRLWELDIDGENRVQMKALLNNNKHTGIYQPPTLLSTHISRRFIPILIYICDIIHRLEFCAPLTSFDWNEVDPTILGTCSIDTTCTIWDVEVSVYTYT